VRIEGVPGRPTNRRVGLVFHSALETISTHILSLALFADSCIT